LPPVGSLRYHQRVKVWGRSLAVAWLVLCVAVLAEGPDDEYVRLYRQLQRADELLASKQADAARREFLSVREALVRMQTNFPGWNPQVVEFRLRYVSERLGETTSQQAPAANPGPMPDELDLLRLRLRESELDRDGLQAKLREALAARPAASDPRELAKAEEKIRAQQKEIEVLRAQLKKQETLPSAFAAREELDAAQQALAQARRELGTQGATVAALLQEKEVLQKRLLAAANGAEIRTLREENAEQKSRLDVLQAEVGEQQKRTESLLAERRVLEKRVAELTAQREADLSVQTAALRNELTSSRQEKLALETENRALRAESTEARQQLALARDLSPPAISPPPDADRMQALAWERDDLRLKLDSAMRRLLEYQMGGELIDLRRLTNQVALLQSRLEVLEARRAPFSAEELALLKAPRAVGTATEARRKSEAQNLSGASAIELVVASGSPADASPVASPPVATARAGRSTSVAALVQLATDQMGRQEFPEAERTLERALADAPQDAICLSLLGQVEFLQGRLEPALDSLSQSAQLDPRDDATFTYLGLTLLRKGLRQPAEAALWRAVQLAPGNERAQYHLAVIYVSQQPPLVELARFHYEKAVAAGLARDPAFEKRLAGLTPPPTAREGTRQ
jgi:cytochrome c-type biogenesis protein CcmH/NrfG